MLKSDRFDSILPFFFIKYFSPKKGDTSTSWFDLSWRSGISEITQVAKGSMIRYIKFNQNFFQKSHKAFENGVSYVSTISIN